MNIKSAIFGLICVKPHTINNVVKRLPYSTDSIYNAVEEMLKEKKIVKIKTDGEMQLDVPKNYKDQKRKEFFIKSLSYGVDPEILIRENILLVWKALDASKTVKELTKKTKLSEKSVRKYLKFFADSELVKFEKRKPLIAVKVNGHPLVSLLNSMIKELNTTERVYSTGSNPFEEIITTPDEIERILYEKIDDSLTIKKTGFIVKGKRDKIAVLESVTTKQTTEEVFLNKLMTPEGVEDACIQILAKHKINFDMLLERAIERNLVNQVGCYLNILSDINKKLVPHEILKKFHDNISNKKYIFLKDEMRYGKSVWEKKYEEKWNVDLYLDIGAVEHGVRGI
jgi:CTP-dependent riboflavin kinase